MGEAAMEQKESPADGGAKRGGIRLTRGQAISSKINSSELDKFDKGGNDDA
jgi:hypothetical protein